MLQSLSLEQYRNIDQLTLECPERGILFIGNNGQGKTNILESIYSLSIGKPYRATTIYDAIQEGQDSCHIIAKTSHGDLEIHAANNPRKQSVYKVHGIKKSFFEFLGNFLAVLFAPEDLHIIRGTPGLRRDYMDSILIRMDHHYAKKLIQYEKTLKQRNALLKAIAEGNGYSSELSVWDTMLAELAKPIWEERYKLMSYFQNELEKKYNALAQKEHCVSIEYQPKKDSEDFLEDLKKRQAKDIIIGSTSIGPHRDDFQIFLNHKEADQYASQGEVRSLILALKYCEVEILERKQQSVVLLLDDVFSELDENRQKALLELTKNRQTFITTTHLSDIVDGIKLVQVQQGNISN